VEESYRLTKEREALISQAARIGKSHWRVLLRALYGLVATALVISLVPTHSLLHGRSFSQVIFDRSGKVLRFTLTNDERYRLSTKLNEVSPDLVRAVLTKEDQWFYWHPGFNPGTILRAAYGWVTRKPFGGASTITMQLSRLLTGRPSRTLSGKLRQLTHAAVLELLYSKQEILEAYLTLAPFGNNIEGVESAARIYFNKEARNLSFDEAHLLAVIPQHPAQRTPTNNTIPRDLQIAAQHLYNRSSSGQKIENLVFPSVITQRRDLPLHAPHFTEIVRQRYPLEEKLVTTLDLPVQKLVEEISSRFFLKNTKLGLHNGAILVVDSRTNAVRAALGSADYWNDSIQGKVNGLRARRSPGSALKPFAYALAIDQGLIHPQTLLHDTAFLRSTYNPENFDGEFMGPLTAAEALVRSRNIPAIQLLQKLTYTKVHTFFLEAGVQELRSADFYGLALVLGGVEVTLEEMARLYLMLARDGSASSLRYLEGYKDDSDNRTTRLLSPEAAYLTREMLKENPRPSEGFGQTVVSGNRRYSWKTGTSHGFRDAWAVGIVGPYVLVVWLGNFDNTPNPALIGRESAGPLFFLLADALQSRLAHDPQATPGNSSRLNIARADVCAVSGALPHAACPLKKHALLIPGVSPIDICSIHRFVAIDPQTGLRSCEGALNPTAIRKSYEFWPSDVLALFAQAGLSRRIPPSFTAGCSRSDQPRHITGKAPLLLSPQEKVNYGGLIGQPVTVPFLAVTDSDAPTVYWFVNNTFYAEGKSREPVLWSGPPGTYVVRAVDGQGRSVEARYTVGSVS
jgi:penicillin-binding protein 1C